MLHDLHDVFEREPVNNHDGIGADVCEVSEIAFQRVVSPDYLVLPQLSFVRSLRLRGLLAAFSSDDVVQVSGLLVLSNDELGLLDQQIYFQLQELCELVRLHFVEELALLEVLDWRYLWLVPGEPRGLESFDSFVENGLDFGVFVVVNLAILAVSIQHKLSVSDDRLRDLVDLDLESDLREGHFDELVEKIPGEISVVLRLLSYFVND